MTHVFDACRGSGLVKPAHTKCPQRIQGTPLVCACECHKVVNKPEKPPLYWGDEETERFGRIY